MSNPLSTSKTRPLLTNEQGPLTEHISLVPLPQPGTPSPREIQSALETLTALQLSGSPGRIHVEPGDIVFYYEFKMVANGEQVYTVRGVREIKEILTDSGISSAPETLEHVLFELIRPLKNRAMKWINEFLENFTKC